MSARLTKVCCPVEGCDLIRSPGAIKVHLRKAHRGTTINLTGVATA